MANNEAQQTDGLIRGYVGISFAVVLIWQMYQIIIMFNYTPMLIKSLSGLGAELPVITRLYLSTYNGFVILPVLTIILAIDIIRRKSIPKAYAMIGFGVVALLTLIMQMFFSQATFAPFFMLVEKI